MGTVDRSFELFSLEAHSALCYDQAIRRVESGMAKPPRKDEGSAETRKGRERRLVERVLVDLEVDYRCEDTFLFAYITDISALGVFVRTNTPENPGTRLNLKFRPPGEDEAFELEGEVAWINPYRPGDPYNLNPGMGIKFVDCQDEQRDRLLRLVRTFAYLNDDEDDEDAQSDTPAPQSLKS